MQKLFNHVLKNSGNSYAIQYLNYFFGIDCVKISKEINKKSLCSDLPKIAMFTKNGVWSFRGYFQVDSKLLNGV